VTGFMRQSRRGLVAATAVGALLCATFLEAGEPGLMLAADDGHGEYTFRGDLAFWGGIAFFGFLYSIKALGLWDALLNSMSARERREVETIATAETRLQQAEAELRKARGQLEALDETTRGIFEEAERDAEYTRNEITRIAKREADAAVHRARHEIERVRDQSVHDLFQALVENIARTTESWGKYMID
jgi:F-type H+-transporting ATPase subunit b